MNELETLNATLRAAWSASTSADPTGWTPENPAWGQCAVTALIVQDAFGGDLLRGLVGGASHYWNRLLNGQIVDLTLEQFGPEAVADQVQVRDRSYVLSFSATKARYEQLCAVSGRSAR